MSIPIYPETCTDFTTNGLGLLTPLECTVEEQAGGLYELTLTHPIDESLRFSLIQPGAIVKAPAPARETPLYEAPAVSAPVTVKRRLWQVERTSVGAYLRSGPGTNHRRLAVKHNGDQVLELQDCGDPWIKVCVVRGGQLGYMSKKWLGLVGEVEETISPGTPAGGMVSLSQSRDQLFRIYSVEQDSAAATVTAHALHIFYDALGSIIEGDLRAQGEDVSSVIAKLSAQAADCPIALTCLNLSGAVSGDYGRKSPVEALLDPDGGVLAQLPALLVRDNFEATLIPDSVRDRGVTIRRGKNLVGAQVSRDDSGVVTRILPVGRDAKGDPLYLPETYVESPRVHARTRTRRIEYDVQVGANGVTSVSAAREKLRKLAAAEFSQKGIDLPAYGMDVDFILLGNTDGYESYASLQAVHLHDTVTVIDELIGLKAKLRVTGYRFNCLSGQYDGVTLGKITSLEQTVYGMNIADGSVTGSKLVPGSVSGGVLRSASIGYAKIASAAIGQLSADALTALTARIRQIVADRLTADELYAAYADLIALKAGAINADNISTDALAAELARITVLAAGTAEFDRATVQHLVSRAMNLEFGSAGQLFIRNLAVEYAQMLGAAVGELCVKASDGSYYLLDVNPDGTVSATPASLSGSEIAAGQTSGGKVILETSIAADRLSTGSLLASYALVNKIDAARIDVDELFAREAFVDLLRTSRIVGNQSITLIAQQASSAGAAAAKAQDAADSAGAAAANAQSKADDASTAAANAQSKADDASTAAANAQSTANSASTAAANAQSTANTANSTANSAKTAAANAQSTANSASTAAANAQSAANAAQATADAALPVVDFQRVVRIDTEGLHVGDNQSSAEVLIDSESVNVVMGGQKYSRFAANYVQFGLYQLRKSADGGLVFKL